MINVNYSLIDFHSHILPRADHGSDSVETSVRQIEMAKQAGITKILATPHFYPHKHTVESFIERRATAYDNLTKTGFLDKGVEIKLGAEVLLCENIQMLEGLDQLCINGTNVLLLELPFSDFSERHIKTVKQLIKNDFDVVLAHVDRYPNENIEALIELGVKLQINASALSGLFSKRYLFDWAASGLVFGLGSDIHGVDKKAYKSFVTASKKLGSSLDTVMNNSYTIWKKAR